MLGVGCVTKYFSGGRETKDSQFHTCKFSHILESGLKDKGKFYF